MLELLFKNKGLLPFFKISQKFPSVIKVDANRLSQVILNLSTNAAKYTQNGTVTVRIEYLRVSKIRKEHYKPKDKFEYTASTLKLDDEDEEEQQIPAVGGYTYLSSDFSNSTLIKRNNRQQINSKSSFTKYSRLDSNKSFNGFCEECNIDYDEEPESPVSIEALHRKLVKQSSKLTHKSMPCLPRIPITIDTALSSGTGFIKIEITDTGCGMSQEEMARIFGKFHRENEEDKSRKIGTGLGLWITKHICSKSEGGIEVFSRKGSGTCFSVILRADTVDEMVMTPLARKGQHHITKADSKRVSFELIDLETEKNIMVSPLPQLSLEECVDDVLRALVVEDSHINSQINKQFLNLCGFAHVDIATNGKEGFELFGSKPSGYYDIITMDMDMPIMNGKESIINIRRIEKQRESEPVTIIMVTGHATQQQKEECLGSPFNVSRFVSKPLGLPTLKSILIELGFGEQYHKSRIDFSSLDLVKENSRFKDYSILLIMEEDFEMAFLKTSIWNMLPKAEFASSYDDAEALMKQKNYEAIFVDFRLETEINSFKFMQKLKEYSKTCNKQPILVEMIEEADEAPSPSCSNFSFKDTVKKPVNIDQVIQALSK